jgi:hypothetical protein
MKALICTVGGVPARWTGDVYLVDNAKGKRPMATREDGFTRSPISPGRE